MLTPENIREAAVRYLDESRYVLGVLVPEPGAMEAAAAEMEAEGEASGR